MSGVERFTLGLLQDPMEPVQMEDGEWVRYEAVLAASQGEVERLKGALEDAIFEAALVLDGLAIAWSQTDPERSAENLRDMVRADEQRLSAILDKARAALSQSASTGSGKCEKCGGDGEAVFGTEACPACEGTGEKQAATQDTERCGGSGETQARAIHLTEQLNAFGVSKDQEGTTWLTCHGLPVLDLDLVFKRIVESDPLGALVQELEAEAENFEHSRLDWDKGARAALDRAIYLAREAQGKGAGRG